MEELIMRILDIEDRAREVISDARKADRELELRIKDDGRKLQSDIERKMEIKNADLRRIEQEDAERQIKKINDETEKSLAELEEKYEKNRDRWVDEIIANIVGR
ncbi:MAG: hypothetical protein HFE49_02320 [Clostridia bacterium]|nr:hypothetical protein [Clostridia bacterium]